MESEKIKKGGWKYDAGDGLLKREGASTFPLFSHIVTVFPFLVLNK